MLKEGRKGSYRKEGRQEERKLKEGRQCGWSIIVCGGGDYGRRRCDWSKIVKGDYGRRRYDWSICGGGGGDY